VYRTVCKRICYNLGMDGQAQPRQWRTVAQVAAELQVHPESVRRWLRSGEMRGVLLSDKQGWRIEAVEARRFMEDRIGGQEVSRQEDKEKAG